MNLVAFSGGVDSSVVAAAVHEEFPENSVCVIGRSAALPIVQLDLARHVAAHIGIELVEFDTHEHSRVDYVKNEGMSCYACKTELYSGLRTIVADVHDAFRSQRVESQVEGSSEGSICELRLFNGTNLDDKGDETRVGLIAADEFEVASPIDHLRKEDVRALAREFGLPNHSHAASPCLRSRLAFGVHATTERLQNIERAEQMVALGLQLDVHHNLRVRHLKDGLARIEVDPDILHDKSHVLGALGADVAALGFRSVTFAEFRSGSVAAIPVKWGSTTT